MQTSSAPVSERQALEHPAAPETVEDALMSLMMALGRRVRHRQPGDTVDFSAFPILKVLSHQGPMRLSALAHVLSLDASTVSRHARQLEDRGLLERTHDPDDRRASRVAVSQRGQDCLVKVFETRRELITHSLDGLSGTERDTLRDLLTRLIANLTIQETDA
jgi:DNA-binding MarR family transcriptional regulator